LWLGDGTQTNTGITTPDPEVVEHIRDYAKQRNLKVREYHQEGNASVTYSITSGQQGGRQDRNPFLNALDSYSLRDGKHIPADYRMNSRSIRLSLLAGVIDSDGHLEQGIYDLVFKSKRLADGVVWLARSLGLAAYLTECTKTIKSRSFAGTYWRICLSGNLETIPTRVLRKQASPRRQKKDVTNVGITVEPIDRGEYFGFELDGDGLFLLGDFTVTHNTSLALQMAAHMVANGRRVYFATLEMSASELALKRLCSVAGVSSQKVRSAEIDSEDRNALSGACEEVASTDFILHDWPVLRVNDIQRAARRVKAEIAFIDYLQKVKPPDQKEQRYIQVGDIAHGLKTMARRLNIPVVACAQLGRQAEQGKEARPRLSSLRESGNIENDADMVWLLWRPKAGVKDGEVTYDAGLEVAKNRKGVTGRYYLDWHPSTTTFISRGAVGFDDDGNLSEEDHGWQA
jgi:replicative DNA helicase